MRLSLSNLRSSRKVFKHSMNRYPPIVGGRSKAELGAPLASSSIEMYSTSLEPGFAFTRLRNVVCTGVPVINDNKVAGLPNCVGYLRCPDCFESCLAFAGADSLYTGTSVTSTFVVLELFAFFRSAAKRSLPYGTSPCHFEVRGTILKKGRERALRIKLANVLASL